MDNINLNIPQQQAASDLEDQLARCYALVAGAKAVLDSMNPSERPESAVHLLDMALDQLGDLNHLRTIQNGG